MRKSEHSTESMHMLVDCLGLLMPITNKRKEVGVIVAQFFGIERHNSMLHQNDRQRQFLDHFVLKCDHISTSDGHTLSMRVTTNCAGMGHGNVKNDVHLTAV